MAGDAATLDAVYEPAEDTWLLCDALLAQAPLLAAATPTLVLEIGPGSGAVSSYVCNLLTAHGSPPFVIGADVNAVACVASRTTAAHSGTAARFDAVHCDLGAPLLQRLARCVDVLLFNPPYVPTPDEEVGGPGIEAAWAGGEDGRVVIDRFLPLIPRLLTPSSGVAFMVVVHENRPADIVDRCAALGLVASTVAAVKARNERLSVLKIGWPNR